MLDCQGKYNSDHNRPGMVEGCSQKQNILMKLSKFQKKNCGLKLLCVFDVFSKYEDEK